MAGLVADASVVAAMVFEEERAEEAGNLLRGNDLYAPGLLAYEMASIARTKMSRNPGGSQVIRQMLTYGLSLGIHWVNVSFPGVVDLALEKGLSTYDASYLYVAMTGGMKLVTFDHRLQAASGL